MSFSVRVRPRARKDIEEASRWYESQQSGLGNEFVDEVQSTFSRIGENPSSYPEIHRGAQSILIREARENHLDQTPDVRDPHRLVEEDHGRSPLAGESFTPVIFRPKQHPTTDNPRGV